jgi:type II secretory pathway pseudopilin PulG
VKISTQQNGNIMIEVLVGIVLLAIMAMGLARSAIFSLSTRERAVRESSAWQLAMDAIEDLSSRGPATLSDANDSDTNVTKDGAQYHRVIDVTINDDSSRTICCWVDGLNSKLGGSAHICVRVLPWGVKNIVSSSSATSACGTTSSTSTSTSATSTSASTASTTTSTSTGGSW